jgi:hypothetical protein
VSNLRPPRGVRADEWRSLLDAAANAIADADMDPSKSGPEEYAAAALRAALRVDRSMWRHVAGKLAERVYHSANCEVHPRESEADDNCPSCRDRAAYRLWERKSGRTHRDRPVPAEETVTLSELAARYREGGDIRPYPPEPS